MQPTQLSLLPDQLPTPAPTILDELPPPEVAAAVSTLASLIAKAASSRAGEGGEGGE
jgi:hypothetical protein